MDTTIQTFEGSIGIGTQNPQKQLHVEGGLLTTSNMQITGNLTVSGNTVVLHSNNVTIEDKLFGIGSGDVDHDMDMGILMEHEGANVALIYHSDEKRFSMGFTQNTLTDDHILNFQEMEIDILGNAVVQNNFSIIHGNVAVGTTPSAFKLDVHGTANVGTLTTTKLITDGTLHVGTSNLVVTSNVGIGTDTPDFDLDVRGTANVGTMIATSVSGDGGLLTGLTSTLQEAADSGNVTSNTVQFSNATTGHVTTGNVEVGRDLSVTGNLTVLGTRTIVDTDTLRVKDPIIELGKDNPGTGDLGLVMTRPSGSSNVAVVFDESTDTLEIGYTQSNASDTDITMRTAATEPLDVNVNGNVSVGKELTVSGNVAVDTDTLVVDSVNDRVGIGTMTPLSDLDLYNPAGTELIVSRNAGSSVNPTIRLWNFDDNNYNNHAVGTSVGTINFSGNERLTGDTHTDDSRAFSYANTLYDWARISALFVGSSDSATTSQGNVRGDLAFYTNGGDVATSDLQERMRIKHNGNVGIGTTTPVAKFEVYGDTILSHGSGYTHNSDDRTLYIGGRNNNGSLQQGKCAIVATPSTSHGGGGVYGRNALHFCVGPDANNDTSASKADSRLCITHTGNVGIGTTSPESSLEVHGTGIHINGTVLRSYSAMGAMTGGQWYKVCDFSALPATTVGVCAIRIQWSGGSLTNVGTYYWSGHASGIVPYNTYGNGSGIYNAAPSEPLTLNQRYHHRTSGAFEFILDSDGSGGSYGRQSIYIKTPQSLSNLSLEVIAMPLRR